MEEEFVKKRKCFLKQFEECRCALSAMGDNNRQLIIRTLMEHTGEGGRYQKLLFSGCQKQQHPSGSGFLADSTGDDVFVPGNKGGCT